MVYQKRLKGRKQRSDQGMRKEKEQLPKSMPWGVTQTVVDRGQLSLQQHVWAHSHSDISDSESKCGVKGPITGMKPFTGMAL